jgi:hypothetical protein
MDIQDGFIVSIFNYCDSWCDACAFTSRCRLFAASAEFEAGPLPPPHTIPLDHEALCEHARTYLDWVFAWRRAHEAFATVTDPGDPRAVVSWFCSLIYVKVRRALRGLAEDDPAERDWPADHDGSAKVALLGVERSQEAWLQIIERGHATWNEVEPFIRQLLWIRDEIERIFPSARAFVRPGFDEPDEVAKLLARSGTGD